MEQSWAQRCSATVQPGQVHPQGFSTRQDTEEAHGMEWQAGGGNFTEIKEEEGKQKSAADATSSSVNNQGFLCAAKPNHCKIGGV